MHDEDGDEHHHRLHGVEPDESVLLFHDKNHGTGDEAAEIRDRRNQFGIGGSTGPDRSRGSWLALA
jgi:hypothetical protein